MSIYSELFDEYDRWRRTHPAWVEYDAPSGSPEAAIRKFFRKHPSAQDQINRRNSWAHVSSSAFVLSGDGELLLRVKKPRYPTGWMQPGSQFFPGGPLDPLDLAMRAVEMDSGYSVRREELVTPFVNPSVPFVVDYHAIPDSPNDGKMGKHYHIDFRYLFMGTEYEAPSTQWSDVVRWDRISDLSVSPAFDKRVLTLINQLLHDFRPDRFLARIARGTSAGTSDVLERRSTRRTIAVAHVIPDLRPYIYALSTSTDLVGVIPKGTVPDLETQSVLSGLLGVNICATINKARLRSEPECLEELLKGAAPTVLIDIGGYFAPAIDHLTKLYPHTLRGIVEDTENGHVKYESVELKLPVISVARSPLKALEDSLVGQSIVFSADAILRQLGVLLQYKKCGVLGYGKIGRSISQHLMLRGCRPSVYDPNLVRQVESINQQCEAPGRTRIITRSEVLFCATGTKSLVDADWRHVTNGAVIFSVTSADDEFGMDAFEHEYRRTVVISHEGEPLVERCSSAHNFFYLVRGGNAVNFVHNAVCGDFIHLVRAEMVAAMHLLFERDVPPGLHDDLTSDMRQDICRSWASIFYPGFDR